MAKLQHVVPQAETHPIKLKNGRLKCLTCGKTVRYVSDNDGPEGLKALLRF